MSSSDDTTLICGEVKGGMFEANKQISEMCIVTRRVVIMNNPSFCAAEMDCILITWYRVRRLKRPCKQRGASGTRFDPLLQVSRMQ